MNEVRSGLFFHPTGNGTAAEVYENTLELIQEAESAGFHAAWVSQLHFQTFRGRLSSPFPFLVRAADRTRHIDLASGVATLPFENPLRLAEDAAVTNVLLQERLSFGVGSGERALWAAEAGVNLLVNVDQSRWDLPMVRANAETAEAFRAAWTQPHPPPGRGLAHRLSVGRSQHRPRRLLGHHSRRSRGEPQARPHQGRPHPRRAPGEASADPAALDRSPRTHRGAASAGATAHPVHRLPVLFHILGPGSAAENSPSPPPGRRDRRPARLAALVDPRRAARPSRKPDARAFSMTLERERNRTDFLTALYAGASVSVVGSTR